jgi:hypothetical protein
MSGQTPMGNLSYPSNVGAKVFITPQIKITADMKILMFHFSFSFDYFPLRDSLTNSMSSLVAILVFMPFISRGERF